MSNFEISLSIHWDPRGAPSSAGPPGDIEGVLKTIEDDFLTEDESLMPLGAKAISLVLLDRPADVVAPVLQRIIEHTKQPDHLPRVFAAGRLMIGEILLIRGEFAAAAEALSDIAAFYATDEDAHLRAIAVSAIESRIRALNQLRDVDQVRAAWDSVRIEYATETHPEIRTHVAGAGRWTAVCLLKKAQRDEEALKACEEVIELYGSDTDVETRANVGSAMMLRYSLLPRRRLVARWQALRHLFHFVGSNPEPEVVEAIRETHPGSADWLLRRAHDSH